MPLALAAFAKLSGVPSTSGVETPARSPSRTDTLLARIAASAFATGDWKLLSSLETNPGLGALAAQL